MKTLYAACLSRLGLTQSGAAVLHDVRIDTVKSWCAGRNRVPQGAWDDLREREAEVMDRADAMLEAWTESGSPAIEIDTAEADDLALMSAADFVLSADADVHVGPTASTRLARQVRRPN